MADLSPDMFGDSMTGQLANQLIQLWLSVRAPVVAPLLQFAINVCLVMVTMLFVERIFMCGVMVFVKLLRRTPESVYKFEPIRDDLEFGNSAYPMVLVQIPMYNEREVQHTMDQISLMPARSEYVSAICIPTDPSCNLPPCSNYMYFSIQVYQLSIQAACGLSWPADRIIIQVLDDSTDQTTRVQII